MVVTLKMKMQEKLLHQKYFLSFSLSINKKITKEVKIINIIISKKIFGNLPIKK